jgi:hypothetical protein
VVEYSLDPEFKQLSSISAADYPSYITGDMGDRYVLQLQLHAVYVMETADVVKTSTCC